jgi:glutathione S-transferase
MAIVLFDLAGARDDHRFSPNCWRAKMALARKGLSFETVPWRFRETEAIAFSGQGAVPVLRDGDQVVSSSWDIAIYLEERYPERPSLFGGLVGRALASFYNDWVDLSLHNALAWVLTPDIYKVVHPNDRDYYRASREKRFGMTLEQLEAGRAEYLEQVRKVLAPLRTTLSSQPFLSGQDPLYPDYLVFGAFMWARGTSRYPELASDDPIFAWKERLLDRFDGLARRAPALI